MYIVVLILLLAQALILVVFGQPLICECGVIKVWSGDIFSADNSQHLLDWYTFSHILHGILFYLLLRKFAPKLQLHYLVLVAMLLEVGWEILENTPWVINHYREQALAQGYTGDSVINSISDTIAMLFGLYLAQISRMWLLVVLVLLFELGTLYMIRDNLTLNVINLVYPSEYIQAWQADK